ncbi:hypothetical protein COCON_G00211880 [Conger conger]|uniref:Uncharacterized protein n=1 Tax=Conger conger TaxID=82655 RepID=A0A9Q1D0S1_CONCO|nr:hypothetical protein COCON_G00211880 [Conger conger]
MKRKWWRCTATTLATPGTCPSRKATSCTSPINTQYEVFKPIISQHVTHHFLLHLPSNHRFYSAPPVVPKMAIDMFPFLEPATRPRRDHERAQRERPDSPPIFIIPFTTEDRAHSPPRYSQTQFSPRHPLRRGGDDRPELFQVDPEGVPPPYTVVELPPPMGPHGPPPPPPPPPPLRSLSCA